jgi:hypothetical protein
LLIRSNHDCKNFKRYKIKIYTEKLLAYKIIQIKDFSYIDLFPCDAEHRGIILCDIDDTILHFGEITKQYFLTVNRNDDPNFIEWSNRIKNETPLLVSETFIDFYNNAIHNGYTFEFITARNDLHIEMTLIHLSFFNLHIHKVHHSGFTEKGIYIKSLNLDYDDIIFIDDSKLNCISVSNNNSNVSIYHLQIT